jgi:hypothetical protein
MSTVVLVFLLQSVFAANVTVLDTDPSIVYAPVASWSPSSNLCSTCLNPGISVSYHEGINSDTAALSTSSSPVVSPSSSPVSPSLAPVSPSLSTVSPSSSPVVSPSSSSTPTTPLPQSSPTSEGEPPSTVSSSSTTQNSRGTPGGPSASSGKGKDSRALARQLPNDAGSVDAPVTLSYNFTGSWPVYL